MGTRSIRAGARGGDWVHRADVPLRLRRRHDTRAQRELPLPFSHRTAIHGARCNGHRGADPQAAARARIGERRGRVSTRVGLT